METILYIDSCGNNRHRFKKELRGEYTIAFATTPGEVLHALDWDREFDGIFINDDFDKREESPEIKRALKPYEDKQKLYPIEPESFL